MSTLRITNIEAKADASSPSVNEKVKVVSSTGTTLLQVDGATSGVSTVTVGTGVTIQGDSGIITATKFSGAVTGDVTGNVTGNLSGDIIGTRTIGTGVTVTAAGIVSATEYYGSGSQLSSIPGDKIVGLIPQNSLTNVDLDGIRKDIALLSLQNAVDSNKAVYNLTNSFIEQYEDSTGIDSLTTASRNDSEYLSTRYTTVANVNAGWGGGSGRHMGQDAPGATSYTGYDGVNRTRGQIGNPPGDPYTGWGFQHIFPADTDFELILYRKGSFQACGYVYGNTITALSQQQFATNGYWGNPANSDGLSGYAGTYQAQYHAPVANDGANVYRNLYRYSRTNGTFKIQYYGRSTNEITVNAASIAAVRASTNYVQSIGGPVTITTKMVLGAGEAASDNDTKIEVANTSVSNFGATGIVTSAQNTVTGARAKVSGVMLYKNVSGTAALGTDLKVSFSCNGGTNWTSLSSASDYTSGADFSTGIKTVYLAEKACTSGTDVRYKIEWANQSDGSKETQVHGMALNY